MSTVVALALPIGMEMFQMYDAGKSGQPYYQTTMTPDKWYEWFEEPSKSEEAKSEEGWTNVRQGMAMQRRLSTLLPNQCMLTLLQCLAF